MTTKNFKLLEGLNSDIQQSLLTQLRDAWTHTSTAIEGNTLSLGDTKFILDEGLTVSGKPIIWPSFTSILFGRFARLAANIPLLNAGLPPLVIPSEQRRQYIDMLARYQLGVGVITPDTGVWPNETKLLPFSEFCRQAYCVTQALVDGARKQQHSRNPLR